MSGHLIVLSLPETALNRWLDGSTVCWLLLICIDGGYTGQYRKTASRNAINPAIVWLDELLSTGRCSMLFLLHPCAGYSNAMPRRTAITGQRFAGLDIFPSNCQVFY